MTKKKETTYKLNTETKTITYYETPEGTPTTYTTSIKVEGDSYPAEISIYGTFAEKGTTPCKSDVSANFMGSLAPYTFVDCVWVDEDTLTFGGRTFNVTTGNVLVEVND